MNKAVKVVVQLQSERLRYEAQAENEYFLNKLDENIQKIIKEQVKEQVKAQVSKILPKIEKTVNEQLKAKVLTHSSNSSKTSHAVAANLSELELKKILIEKIESNKSINRSDEHKNLYKALVDAYECDKLILDTYEDAKQAKPPTPDRAWNKTFPATHGPIQPWINNQARKDESRTSFNELMDTPLDFSAFVMNQLKVDTLTPELLAGKLTNLTVDERLAFNVSLRMFTRSIVIQQRVEDLQLAYSNPRGFIYQNKDKQNRLMRIDELQKFINDTLNDVRNALDDRLKGIQMKYLPQTIWRRSDKDRAAAMIQAIDKQLKTRRIMRSLEKFVGGRLYEGDFWMLQRTI
nr:hypothetical protein [Tanacetum cinerariifolium]